MGFTPMKQPDLWPMARFDADLSDREKAKGMALAAERREELLRIARGAALEIARHVPEITSDDVREALTAQGIECELGPAFGSLFKTRDWRWTGRWQKSRLVSNHSRMIRVWRRSYGSRHEPGRGAP